MVRIPHQEDERFTYEDFDFMCTVLTGREPLCASKTLHTGRENQKKLLAESIAFLILGAVIYVFQTTFAYILFAFGGILLLITFGLYSILHYSYKKFLEEGPIKGDIVFDEAGVHVWENDKKGFDAAWDDLLHCFISKLRIVILFRDEQLVIDLPYTPQNKDKVIEALKEGHKLSVVKLLDYEKGKISRREI